MFGDEIKDTKPLNEVINLVVENCYMQVSGIDVGTPFIAGPPGGGKTASIHYLSDQYDFNILSTHLALKPIEETGGIPQFEKITINGQQLIGTIWSFPDIMKKLFDYAEEIMLDKDGKPIINPNTNQPAKKLLIWLLDDAHLLSQIHMALMYELLTERTLRGYKIPSNCAIVMAGNTSNKSGAKTMFSAIVNRCVFMPVHTDFNSWKRNFAMRDDVNLHQAFVSFLSNDQYQKFFHEAEQVDSPWGSPRSWTRFANEIAVRESWKKELIPSDICSYIGAGYVGREAASDFVSYYKIYSEFDLDTIMANPKTYQLPDDGVKRYALAYALINYYIGKDDRSKILSNMAYLISLYMKDHPELVLMMMREMEQLEKTLKKRNVVTALFLELKKIEPDLSIQILKDFVELKKEV